MIEKDFEGNYVLTCDHCGDECEEVFENFYEAVDYKQNSENNWRTIKDKNGDWQELCPACNQPDIILELRAQ